MERTRREFICESTTLLAGAAVLADAPSLLAAPAPAVNWPVGCFNRPWTKWTFDETLNAIKAAGYATTGLLSRTKTDPFIAADATPEYLDGLKRTLAASGLTANMGALRSRHDLPLEETVKSLHKEIDNAAFLGLKYVMTFGIDATKHYHRLQIQEFLQAILAGRAPMIPGEEGRKTVEIFTAIYRSQRDGRPVRFPLAPETRRGDFDGRKASARA